MCLSRALRQCTAAASGSKTIVTDSGFSKLPIPAYVMKKKKSLMTIIDVHRYGVLLTSIAISFISCLVLLFHIAGTVNIHAIESGLKASEHRSVSSSKIKYLRCRKASVNMRVAGRDALLAAII